MPIRHPLAALAWLALAATVAAAPTLAGATVPATVGLEGALLATAGPAADGAYDLTVSLWDAPTGGTAVWTEKQSVTVTAGRFALALGEKAALGAQSLGAPIWLGVQVGSEPELPRQPLRSTPYALRAALAEAAAFPYAASKTIGGPAADLACTGCVSVAEMKFDGDLDLGGNSLKAAGGTFTGDVVAKTVTATAFVGDGSGLTGIAQPKGSCKAGEAVVGIAADGTLQCKAVVATLPPGGLDEVSNGLLTNQFVESVALPAPLAIPDATGASANAMLTLPSWGIAESFTVKVKLQNTDLASVALRLLPPDDKKTGYLLCDPCGEKDAKALDTAWSDKLPPKAGDLASWLGKDAKGTWNLVATDSSFCIKQAPGNGALCDLDNKTDGAITSFSIEVGTLSSQKVAAKGDLAVAGMLRPAGLTLPTGTTPPSTCSAATLGQVYVDSKLVALRVCNGSDWVTIALVAWGTKTQPGKDCADLKAKDSGLTSGSYWIDPDGEGGVAAYQAHCEMELEGGGWTRIIRLQGSGDTGLAGVPNSQAYVDNGTFHFSKAQLLASNREVLVVETAPPYRMHRYDFKQFSNLAGENFVGALTGDVGGTVAVWNWKTGQWQFSGNGQCNNNNHSQWNCTPPSGVSFHYATRDWTGNGGSSENAGWTWFTGYNTGYGDLGSLVKNWNGAYDKTKHDIFVR